MGADLSLADLLASLSLVSDLGLGLPPEDAMRSCLVGSALARELGLDERHVAEVFYVSLLQHVGCAGYAHETYLVWIDDLAANRAAQRTNFARPRELFTAYLPSLIQGMGAVERARIASRFATRGPGFLKRFTTATCEVATESARRLRLSEEVQRGLHQVFEGWNGKGAPGLTGRRHRARGTCRPCGGCGGEVRRARRARARCRRGEAARREVPDPSIAETFAKNGRALLEAAGRGSMMITA